MTKASTQEVRKKFGDWLRGVRERLGLRQQDVADRSELGLQQYHRIEKGRARSKVDTIERIAEALNLPSEETLERWNGITHRMMDLPPILVHFNELPPTAREIVSELIEVLHRRHALGTTGDQAR